MSAILVGGMFAGYGGLERAVHDVWPNARPAWFAQYDPDGGKRQAPSRILAHHWPDVPNHGDVTRIDWSVVQRVHILTGGFPCQDVSPAGLRNGLQRGQNRSGLWVHMAVAIDALRPPLVIIENVRGLLSAKADSDVEQCAWCVGGPADGEPALRALGAVLGDLAEIGYDAQWVTLPASGVGAPHQRERVFILAWPAADADRGGLEGVGWLRSQRRDPDRRPGAGQAPADLTLLPTPAVNDMGASYTPEEWDAWTARMRAEHDNGNGHGNSLSVEALRLLPTPRTSDTNGASSHGTGGDDLRTVVDLLPTPTAADGDRTSETYDRGNPTLVGALLPTPRASRGASGTETIYALGGERSDKDRHQGLVLMPTPRATDGAKGGPNQRGSSGDLMLPSAVQDFGPYAAAVARWEAVTRPAPPPTEPTGKGGAHRLSPRFVEWMQGLPDGWVTDVPGITRNDMLKALGNGVVPQQAAEGIRWVLDHMGTTKAVAS